MQKKEEKKKKMLTGIFVMFKKRNLPVSRFTKSIVAANERAPLF